MSKNNRGYKPLSANKIAQILSNNPSVKAQAKAACQPAVPPAAPQLVTLEKHTEFDSLLAVDKTRDFLAFARDVISRYEGNVRRQKELEDQTQDLLHAIELSPRQNAANGYKMYQKLFDVRNERRQCKNEIDLLKPLYDYLADKRVINDLTQIQGKCNTSKQNISHRQYTLRTDVMN